MKTKYLVISTIVFFLLASTSVILFVFESTMPGNYEIIGNALLYQVLSIVFLAGFVLSLVLTFIHFLDKKSLSFSITFCGVLIAASTVFYFLSKWENAHLYTDIFSWLTRMAFVSLCVVALVTLLKALKRPVSNV